MNSIVHPLLIYALCVVGGAGVCLALPRGGRLPQILGALLAATVGGAAMLVLAIVGGEHHASIYFYVFAFIALGSALRVITHPRPVYAALYFILTVLASAGLFLLLSAEFMAFALVIVYAGAILITYLFVIMLASQAPHEDEVEVLREYDTTAREPVAATVAGFILLALLTGMMFKGVPGLPAPKPPINDVVLEQMPVKAERALRAAGKLKDGQTVAIDSFGGTIVVNETLERIERKDWPESLRTTNVEALGFNLLRDHPGTIEIAGVILLMAMLGAVVLSRKQVQLDEEAKRSQAHRLGLMPPDGGGA
ncbi:MAG: NADH-quinone oxidoreductase subunit J [Planctomycetota bacterium]|nr:NADH-quinone oxidoreductase subunit J [Planctomycetota bacterium]